MNFSLIHYWWQKAKSVPENIPKQAFEAAQSLILVHLAYNLFGLDAMAAKKLQRTTDIIQ